MKDRMLSMDDFNALSNDQRAERIRQGGRYLTETDHPLGRSTFYTYLSFHVEMVTRRENGRILEIVGFRSGGRYDRLLKIFDLDKV